MAVLSAPLPHYNHFAVVERLPIAVAMQQVFLARLWNMVEARPDQVVEMISVRNSVMPAVGSMAVPRVEPHLFVFSARHWSAVDAASYGKLHQLQ